MSQDSEHVEDDTDPELVEGLTYPEPVEDHTDPELVEGRSRRPDRDDPQRSRPHHAHPYPRGHRLVDQVEAVHPGTAAAPPGVDMSSRSEKVLSSVRELDRLLGLPLDPFGVPLEVGQLLWALTECCDPGRSLGVCEACHVVTG